VLDRPTSSFERTANPSMGRMPPSRGSALRSNVRIFTRPELDTTRR
jgi:hypothetical protein